MERVGERAKKHCAWYTAGNVQFMTKCSGGSRTRYNWRNR